MKMYVANREEKANQPFFYKNKATSDRVTIL